MPFRLFNRRVAVAVFVASFTVVLAVAVWPAKAATYTDATGDNYGGPEVDISNVVVTNDASNITFQINLNPSASIGPTGSAYFANYELGVQVGGGAGGQTAINATYGTGDPTAGNAYGSAVGISSGENFFVGTYLDGPSYSGGAQLYSYSTASGWAQIGSTAPITEIYSGTPSVAFTFSLASLGLSPGNTFNFDVWTTFSGGQGAYDALDNTTGTPNSGGLAPYSGGSYDSATASGSTLASYTVAAVPEPSAIILGAMGGFGLLALCTRRRASRS